MICIVYDVKRYRQKLEDTVRCGDTVVEIGPHKAKSTDAYISKASLAVLVDKGRDCEKYLSKYCDVRKNAIFVSGDARTFDVMAKAAAISKGCDVLAVDMGGGRFADTVFKVWSTWAAILKPRDSVIRCRGLGEFIYRARVDDKSIRGDYKDSGWLSEYGRATPQNVSMQLDEFKNWVDI